ncbi:TIGR02281 family clan AA aspartic protease [Thioalkalivibrio sp. ALR17-21]|uniref:retropepsin-like aspartic protease family protein n=1 Tax=Thioalkalivibrio sp. ALR17-21 TaxID=1269813 RepID=UPI00041F4F54
MIKSRKTRYAARFVIFAAAFAFPGVAAADITVHAVFDGRAVLSVDGERAVVAEGESGPGGVRVLQAGGGRVQVEFAGETRWLERGAGEPASTGAGDADSADGEAAGREREAADPGITVYPDSRGVHSLTVGVNGRAITMEVDREAESVMLRERDAERAGVDADAGNTVHLRTERGRVNARRVTLDEVRVGGIRRSGVSAVIVPDDHIHRARLGRTFLDRVEVEPSGDALILR